MGKVISRLNKQFYRFNAENRALREISKEKPSLAPRHASTEEAMKDILEETKHIKQEAMMKDPALDEYLKKVYVQSHDPVEMKKERVDPVGLPVNRSPPEEVELGYFEPSVIPKGKATLLQVMRFINDHQGDPQLYSASRISKDYDLSEKDVDMILNYFSSFKVHIREEKLQVEGRKDKILKYFGGSNKPVMISNKEVVIKSDEPLNSRQEIKS